MDYKELGERVATMRKDKKISQQTLATDLGISRATLSSFENGNSVDIGLRKVMQIIDYLGYEIDIREKSMFPVFEDLVNGQF